MPTHWRLNLIVFTFITIMEEENPSSQAGQRAALSSPQLQRNWSGRFHQMVFTRQLHFPLDFSLADKNSSQKKKSFRKIQNWCALVLRHNQHKLKHKISQTKGWIISAYLQQSFKVARFCTAFALWGWNISAVYLLPVEKTSQRWWNEKKRISVHFSPLGLQYETKGRTMALLYGT